jgi:hypothetical protein
MSEKLKAAAIGGVILGLLSAIPFVNFVNICCCAWVLLGGALAVMFYVKKSPTPVSIGAGAGVGALAGLIGGVIYVIIGLPLQLLTGNAFASLIYGLLAKANPDQAEVMQRAMEQQMNMGIGERFLYALPGVLIGFCVIVVFATIGGLIGVPIFEKRKGGPNAPPPPQNFNPQGGGGYPPQNYGQPGGGSYRQ